MDILQILFFAVFGVTTLAGRWIGRTAHIPILGLIALLFVVYVMSAPEATL
ncbi:MAG: hypothetical protein AAGK22_30005 [Acidobacteriota bacterium]